MCLALDWAPWRWMSNGDILNQVNISLSAFEDNLCFELAVIVSQFLLEHIYALESPAESELLGLVLNCLVKLLYMHAQSTE